MTTVANFIFIGILTVLLVIRLINMVRYYDAWNNSTDEVGKRTARTNFFIHLGVCLLLAALALWFGYRLFEAMRT